MTKQKISIIDVARRANVSITTVSRVLNNYSSVKPKNRSRIEEAIAFFKFKPNVNAQRLASGINNSISLVMPGYPGIFHSFYAIELIRGVGHACEGLRQDLVFHISDGNNSLNSTNVSGIIFADVIENRKQVEAALANGTPCVIINNESKDLDVSYIAVDNRLGGEMVANYLISFGHKRIATITGNLNTQSGAFRLEGFKKFLEKKNVGLPKEYVYIGDYSRRSARIGVEQFLKFETSKRPTAIFAASDDMALEIIASVMEAGLKVPGDISVIGFDDNPACLYGPVGLTTMRQPLFKMAEDSVRLLHSLVTGKQKNKVRTILPPELVIRESCNAPRN